MLEALPSTMGRFGAGAPVECGLTGGDEAKNWTAGANCAPLFP
jgi:hypothetical protein